MHGQAQQSVSCYLHEEGVEDPNLFGVDVPDEGRLLPEAFAHLGGGVGRERSQWVKTCFSSPAWRSSASGVGGGVCITAEAIRSWGEWRPAQRREDQRREGGQVVQCAAYGVQPLSDSKDIQTGLKGLSLGLSKHLAKIPDRTI